MNARDPCKAEIGVEIMPFELGFLPPYFEKKAESEMNDTEETRKRCIQELKDMVKKGDKSIKNIEFAEEFLLQYLRTLKFNVGKSFQALKAFVSLVKSHPMMFTNFSFETTVKPIKDNSFTFLPWRCHDGCAVLYVQIRNWDHDNFPIEEVKRMLVVVLMQSLRDPMTQVQGIKIIVDIESPNYRYLKHCSLANLYLLYHATQHCAPGRYKEFHVVNHNLLFKSVWLLGKTFMSQKMQDRVYFHHSTDKLLDFFPRTVVPEKYGGDLVVQDQTEWLRKMMSPEQLAMIGGGALNFILTTQHAPIS